MQEATKNKEILIGGSIFWVAIILLALSWLTYLGIWSYQNNSIKGVVISSIFFAMIITGVVFSKFEIFNLGTWRENAISFGVGFAIWAAINGFFGTQSILSVTQNHLFATISGELPQFIDVLMNGFVVPIAEELFWMFAIPYAVITIMTLLGKKYGWMKNNVAQIIFTAAISGFSFAYFHVGREALTYFIIAALLFRTVMIVLVFGDARLDWLKGFNLVASFSIGAHIANNIFQGGIKTVFQVLPENMVVFIIIIVFFGAIFLTMINELIRWIIGDDKVRVQV